MQKVFKIGDSVFAKTKYGFMPGIVELPMRKNASGIPSLYSVTNLNKQKAYTFQADKVFPRNPSISKTEQLSTVEKLYELEQTLAEARKAIR